LPVSNGPGAAVYFAVPRVNRGKTTARIIDTSGQLVGTATFNATGTLLIGDYAGSGKEQIALASGTTLHVYDIATQQTTTTTITDGSYLDDFNTGAFEKKLDGCGCTTKSIAKRGYCPSTNSGKCQDRKPVTDGGGNWLHKPVSDSTHSIVDLFPSSQSPSDCRYERTSGKKVADAYSSGRTNGNRSTWRPRGNGWCSTFPKPLVLNCKINGKSTCRTIPDPCNRYD